MIMRSLLSGLLPINLKDVHNIAVIGPHCNDTQVPSVYVRGTQLDIFLIRLLFHCWGLSLLLVFLLR